MNLVFNARLRDGREVYVECVAEVTERCDCSAEDTLHRHVDGHEYEQITDEATGFDIILTDAIREQLDREADAMAYSCRHSAK